MTVKKELKIGILMLLGLAIISAMVGDFGLILFTAGMSILGLFSIFLYQFKVKGATTFLMLKVPLNIFFNIFLITLLLKSWAMREFKEDLEQLNN